MSDVEKFFEELRKELREAVTKSIAAQQDQQQDGDGGDGGDAKDDTATAAPQVSADDIVAKLTAEDSPLMKSVGEISKDIEVLKEALSKTIDRVSAIEQRFAVKKSADGNDVPKNDDDVKKGAGTNRILGSLQPGQALILE